MESLTLFTWGYWGWGNATRQLIEAVDAVEDARGFAPPLFVDIRLSRSVRAPGFNGRAFEDAVGSARYRWMPDLGNLAVQDGGDEPIKIKNPAAAETLLEIADEAARESRRVLFFCACETPGLDGEEGCCHRTRVAGLLLEAARRRNRGLRIAEWPGGEPLPAGFQVDISEAAFAKVHRGSAWIPLEEPVALADVAGLPWGTLTFVHCRGKGPEAYFRLLAGPARFAKTGWQLPVCEDIEPAATAEDITRQVSEFRAELGYAVREAAPGGDAGSEQPAAPVQLNAAAIEGRPKPMKRPGAGGSGGAFMAPLIPSPVLAAIVGDEPLVRTEVTSRIWNHIVANKLQDPVNKRLIRCDDKLRALTGQDDVDMFELTKFVSANLQ